MEGGPLDPITLSVLSSALAGIGEEMGTALVRSAYSANIKERRDCSAALFDAAGRMVAQAEHIPVHLGAMPEAVAAVIACDPAPGDVHVLNDPYSGGNHLPDVTMVAPLDVDGERLAYAVTRAHHSDIGGMQPGSMPAGSRDIFSEGLVIPPVRLVAGGEYVPDVLKLLLANTRTPAIRRGDFRAQIAATRLAQERLGELVGRWGRELVLASFDGVIAATERRTREAIRRLPDGEYTAASELEGDGVLDDDIPIRVTVQIRGDELRVDFSGTAGAVPGNVNCPLAVTRSACIFALRVLVADDLPTNAGTWAPLDIQAEPGSLVNARRPSAVVAGNVETSSRIADLVLSALGGAVEVPAQGQGTMNNLTLAGEGFTYYETIGGGQGACPDADGPSAIHVAMSNTLNTPVEALETEFPLRVRELGLRRGSGGDGRHRGGEGIVRELEALAPMRYTWIAERRRRAPGGRDGGADGARGSDTVNGEPLASKAEGELRPGDRLRIETPGGGGCGEPDA